MVSETPKTDGEKEKPSKRELRAIHAKKKEAFRKLVDDTKKLPEEMTQAEKDLQKIASEFSKKWLAQQYKEEQALDTKGTENDLKKEEVSNTELSFKERVKRFLNL